MATRDRPPTGAGGGAGVEEHGKAAEDAEEDAVAVAALESELTGIEERFKAGEMQAFGACAHAACLRVRLLYWCGSVGPRLIVSCVCLCVRVCMCTCICVYVRACVFAHCVAHDLPLRVFVPQQRRGRRTHGAAQARTGKTCWVRTTRSERASWTFSAGICTLRLGAHVPCAPTAIAVPPPPIQAATSMTTRVPGWVPLGPWQFQGGGAGRNGGLQL